jgi:hypothetical protein
MSTVANHAKRLSRMRSKETSMPRRRRTPNHDTDLELSRSQYHNGYKDDDHKGGSPSKKVRWRNSFQKISKVSLSGRKKFGRYLFVSGVVYFTLSIMLRRQPPARGRPTEQHLNELPIVLPRGLPKGVRPFYHMRIKRHDEEEEYEPHFGDIDYWSLKEEHIFVRRLDPDDAKYYAEFIDAWWTDIDEDEHDFEEIYEPDEDIEDHDNPCRRNNWKEKRFPTCNSVHELTIERPQSYTQNFDIKYLG